MSQDCLQIVVYFCQYCCVLFDLLFDLLVYVGKCNIGVVNFKCICGFEVIDWMVFVECFCGVGQLNDWLDLVVEKQKGDDDQNDRC